VNRSQSFFDFALEFLLHCGAEEEYARRVLTWMSGEMFLVIYPMWDRQVSDFSDLEASEFIKRVASFLSVYEPLLGNNFLFSVNAKNYLREASTSVSFKDSQFGSCSYYELTENVKHRVKQLREFREFRKSESAELYPSVKWSVVYKSLTIKEEIKYILEKRREMKRDSREARKVLEHSLKMGGFR